jgi:hypothetical protein
MSLHFDIETQACKIQFLKNVSADGKLSLYKSLATNVR